ncbi:helix-turn-helix transcriptional regulator [Algibacter luteus]|uniref:helix-turn-helix transcriptional regulator n=1 Tax=Algibacter luteus TaxID=1178825 RepID=UPI0025941AC1|nr:hypothetical protein [Algibacter luteus]WJJ97796.1 hypothetical protein O5O44_05265 [Algibacter luteus]
MIIKIPNKFFLLFTLCFGLFLSAQNDHQEGYLKYIESADNALDENPKIAALYLDSIPQPLKKSIKGHLACYYKLKVLINDKNKETAKLYQNSILTLKYAEQEKNYDIAGWASLELFYNTNVIKKDSSAFKYLEDAQKFYSLSKNKYGLAEVTQMYALAELNNDSYNESNRLLLKNLEEYKSIEDDAYYYMYGLYLLTTNYIHLDSLNLAHKYFTSFKKLEDNKTITPLLFNNSLATIYGSLGGFHFKKKDIDSTLFYFAKSDGIRYAMNDNDKRNYYNLYIDYYDFKEDYKSKNNYIDSLRILEDQVLKKTMDAGLLGGDNLMNSESELVLERNKKNTNRLWALLLFIIVVLLASFYIIKHKRLKKIANKFDKSNDEFSYLKSNHEKLKLKVHGLEEYLSDVKKEIKSISSLEGGPEQRQKIKELYKNLHLNASLLLNKNEDHLKLVNDLNIDFFTKIKNNCPQLNDSDILICYYLFVGFKSKEIAVFLKTTTRAIEGRRYRIRKKLNLQENDLTLQEILIDDYQI